MSDPIHLAKIEGDEIVIRIPIKDLCSDHFIPDDLFDGDGDPKFTVINRPGFAQDVVNELNRDNGDDGMTPIHEMIDSAYVEAIDQGSNNVDENLKDEEDYDEDDVIEDVIEDDDE